MKKKAAEFVLVLSAILLVSAAGQTASPSLTPAPSAKSSVTSPAKPTATGPIVTVRVIVRCDEAAIRDLVDKSLRSELAKLPNVSVIPGNGRSSLIVGAKLVPVTGVQTKSPLYAMQFALFDMPVLFSALETVGLRRQVIQTLLIANEIQPVREENLLLVVSKDELPGKIASLMPTVQTRGVERAQVALLLNQQRKPGAQSDTEAESGLDVLGGER